jgi:hypothetical protein
VTRAKVAIGLWLVACTLSGVVFVNEGFVGRFDAAEQQVLSSMDKFDYYDIYQRGTCFSDQLQPLDEYPEGDCIPDEPGKSVLIVGDSFAAHLFPGLKGTLLDSGYLLSQATKASCSYVPPAEETSPSCRDFREYVVSDLIPRMKPDLVIYSERWARFEAGPDLPQRIETAIAGFGVAGSQVVVVGPTPGFSSPVPRSLVISGDYSANRGADFWLPCIDDTAVWDALVSASQAPDVQLVKMDEATRRQAEGSSEPFCLAASDEGPLHWDGGHLTQAGSDRYSDYLWARISLR